MKLKKMLNTLCSTCPVEIVSDNRIIYKGEAESIRVLADYDGHYLTMLNRRILNAVTFNDRLRIRLENKEPLWQGRSRNL